MNVEYVTDEYGRVRVVEVKLKQPKIDTGADVIYSMITLLVMIFIFTATAPLIIEALGPAAIAAREALGNAIATLEV